MKSSTTKTKLMCMTAVLTAFIFLLTRLIQIPIPLGYINLGNGLILLSCILLPFPYGIFAGSLGSALADLTSYPVFTVPTLIIKALMPLLFYGVYSALNKRTADRKKSAPLIAAAAAMLIPVIGYAVVCGFLYGSFYMGLVQLPLNFIEYGLNMAFFVVLLASFLKLRKHI